MTLTATNPDSSIVLMCQLFQSGLGAVVKDAVVTFSKGFFQLSLEEKSLLRKTELVYRKNREEELNTQYQVKIQQAADDYEKEHSTLKEKKPKVFLKERERAIFQVSQQLLREEQAKLWPQSIPPNFPLFLLDIQGNFIIDRWLECLLCEDKNPEATSNLIKHEEAIELDYDIFNYSLKDIQNKYAGTRLGKFAELVIEDTRSEVSRLKRVTSSSQQQNFLDLYRKSSKEFKKLLFMVTLTKCNQALVKLQTGLFEELYTHIPSLRNAVGDNQSVLGCFETLEHLQGLLNSKAPVKNSLSVTLPKDFKAEDKRKIRDIAQELSRQNKELSEAFLELRFVLQGKKEEIEKDKGTSVPAKEKEPRQMESSRGRKVPSARGTPTADTLTPSISNMSLVGAFRAPGSPPTNQAAALLSARVTMALEPQQEQKKERTATVSSALNKNEALSPARKLTNDATPDTSRGRLIHTKSFMVRPVVNKGPTAKGAPVVRSPDGVSKVAPLTPPEGQPPEMHKEFGELIKKALATRSPDATPRVDPPDSPGQQAFQFHQEFDELIKIAAFYKTVEQLSTIFERLGKLLPMPAP